MKKMIFILSTLIFSQYAQANFEVLYESNLKNIVSDFGNNPTKGKLVYNVDKHVLTLTFFYDMHCPGEICAAYIPTPLVVELPVVSVQNDSCGAKVINAEKNMMHVDGAVKRITVVDNSTNYCQYIRAIAPIEGEFVQSYMDSSKGIVTSKTTFDGNAFVKTADIE